MKRHSTYNTYLTKINNIFNTDLLHSIAILLLLFILLTYTNTIHQTHSQPVASNFTPIGQANCLAGGSGFQAIFAGYSRPTTTASTTYYTISGLNINNPGANSQGLFSCASNATITDVIIKNSRIIGNSSVGSLLGFAGANVNIFNSGVSNSEVNGFDNSVGGLVGQVAPGTTTAIFNLANSYSLATTTGGSGVGGLIGVATGSAKYVNIQNSYMAGLVKSTAQAQGVATSTLGTTGNSPVAITIDPQGNIYTANEDSGTVTRITAAGAISTITVGVRPMGIVSDSSGNIYVANYYGNSVSKISPAGLVTNTFSIVGSGTNPAGIVVDSSGNIYTSNNSSANVTKITPAGVVSTLGSTGVYPGSMTIDTQGNIYTGNWGSDSVTRITPAGSTTNWQLPTNSNPWGITIDSIGNIYTANYTSNKVSKITPAGVVNGNFASTGPNPRGIAVDSIGNIYIANSGSNTVTKITPAGVTSTITVGNSPKGVITDTQGNIYTANWSSYNVSKITSSQPTATLGGLIGENGIVYDDYSKKGYLNLVNNLVLGKINPVTVNGLVSSATGFLIGKNQAALAGVGYGDTNIVSYSNYCNDRLDNGYNTASLASPNGMQLIGGANPLRFSAYNTEANKSLSPTTNAIATGQQGARTLTTSSIAATGFKNIIKGGVILKAVGYPASNISSRGTSALGPTEFQFFNNGNDRNIPAIYRNTNINVPTDLVAGQFINNVAATTSDIRNYINYIPTCPIVTNSKAVT